MNPAPGADTPATVDLALRQLADWLDEADRLIDRLAAVTGRTRSNRGDEVQTDLRRLADWFGTHPDEAHSAWAYARLRRVPAVRDRREPGDPPWTATELLGVTPEQERAARMMLARHFRVLASAVGVTDWPAYLRSVADAHDAGTAWLDPRYVAPGEDACPDDPDGLHHSGCGCVDVDPINPNERTP